MYVYLTWFARIVRNEESGNFYENRCYILMKPYDVTEVRVFWPDEVFEVKGQINFLVTEFYWGKMSDLFL
jgi:hypothetical protein